MKTTVEIGKTYALRSEAGGEVTDVAGKTLETLEPNKQVHMTAQESEWVVPDDCKVTKVNFKQALAALGLLGEGNSSDLPKGYVKLEFLESSGTQYIDTGLSPEGLSSLVRWEIIARNQGQLLGYYNFDEYYKVELGENSKGTGVSGGCKTPSTDSVGLGVYDRPIGFIGEYEINADENFLRLNDRKQQFASVAKGFSEGSGPIRLFAQGRVASSVSRVTARVFFYRFWRNGQDVCHFIPALGPTGAPCLFDLVTRKPFYNSGTGDFLYPGKEMQATTYSLRRPRMYAQVTEHGIRRLYHVPRGYNGTPEEYAEQNGFKLLVETPAPEEGYWAPVWHEREDCIELEWVETEPPAEELLTEA